MPKTYLITCDKCGKKCEGEERKRIYLSISNPWKKLVSMFLCDKCRKLICEVIEKWLS